MVSRTHICLSIAIKKKIRQHISFGNYYWTEWFEITKNIAQNRLPFMCGTKCFVCHWLWSKLSSTFHNLRTYYKTRSAFKIGHILQLHASLQTITTFWDPWLAWTRNMTKNRICYSRSYHAKLTHHNRWSKFQFPYLWHYTRWCRHTIFFFNLFFFQVVFCTKY